jgi:hypothetical protein
LLNLLTLPAWADLLRRTANQTNKGGIIVMVVT